MKQIRFIILLFVIITACFSCQKPVFTVEKGTLKFSSDTVKFDTIFTSMRSPSEWLIVHNPTNNNIKVARIWLESGAASEFELIIDGVKSSDEKEVIIPAKDSVHVFVSMKSQAKDKFINENIRFQIGGKTQTVPIRAYIVDAYFYPTTAIFTYIDGYPNLSYDTAYCNLVLKNDKPHVIDGPLYVPKGCTLTIEAGAQIYFTPFKLKIKVPGQLTTYLFFSMLHVAGTLKIQGQPKNPVVLQQSRLQTGPYYDYTEQPGQWRGIWLTSTSKDNVIEHALIKNGMYGVEIDSASVNNNPKLRMSHSKIRNQQSVGLVTTYDEGVIGSVPAVILDNCLIHSCPGGALNMARGGWNEFYNCTFDNSGRFQSKDGTVGVFNYYSPEPGKIEGPYDIRAKFFNCIIWGNSKHELVVGDIEGKIREIVFDHCATKIDEEKYNYDGYFASTLKGQNPSFKDVGKNDFRLNAGSPCINAGIDIPAYPFDIRGDTLHQSPFDIGAYEFY